MTQPFTIDLDQMSVEPAKVALSWAVHNLQREGNMAPTEVWLANELLLGRVRVSNLTSLEFGTVAICESSGEWGDDDVEDILEIFALIGKRLKRRRLLIAKESLRREMVGEDIGLELRS